MSSDQGTQYHAFVAEQMKAEYERRTTLEARGLAVVTGSGTLVTLVFGIGAFVLGKDYKPSATAVWALGVSLVLFIVAAFFGLLANFLRKYEVASPTTVNLMLTTHWTDTEVAARNVCAVADAETLKSLRAGSNDKAQQVTVALICQLLATGGLAFAVLWEFAHHHH
ncbi:MAG: hypothetical protein QOC82_1131 [Frankiaceae bacterium]|jgi:hypothetical protein|nr:hypothetical protein [Frankiaceae bacterium]